MSIASIILDMLFPKKCIACGKEGKYVCKSCELYMLDAPQVAGLTALWEYNGIVKELIQRVITNGEYDIIRELVNKKEFDVAEDAVITYVPMHIKEQKKRGFSQAEMIAKEIGRKVNKPVVRMLEKVKETGDQMNLEQRLEGLEGCFVPSQFCGNYAKVLLINDVYITGEIMQECSKVLKKAGVEEVWGFAIAKMV